MNKLMRVKLNIDVAVYADSKDEALTLIENNICDIMQHNVNHEDESEVCVNHIISKNDLPNGWELQSVPYHMGNKEVVINDVLANNNPTLRFYVDERVGCIAVMDSNMVDFKCPGLHSDTKGLIKRWDGIFNNKNGWWEVPDNIRQKAVELCELLNKE